MTPTDTPSSLRSRWGPVATGAGAVLALTLLLIGATRAPAPTGSAPPETYRFTAPSAMQIKGTATMHSWSCDVTNVEGEMQVAPSTSADEGSSEEASSPHQITAATVTAPVAAIECGNGRMNRDLRKAMQAAQHPTIRFEVEDVSIEAHPDSSGEWQQFRSTGTLSIAGSTRTTTVVAAGRRQADGRIRLVGEKTLRMTDFGIEPPTALLGMMQTGDEVTIPFNVTAAPASTSTASSTEAEADRNR